MKSVVPALILPILMFSFAGTWAGIGSMSFHIVAQDAFNGSVFWKGVQISNAVASISASFAWIALVIALFTNQKSIVLFSFAALLIPGLHSIIFVEQFYTSEIRNSLNHIAFLVAICSMAMVCLTYLLTISNDEQGGDGDAEEAV